MLHLQSVIQLGESTLCTPTLDSRPTTAILFAFVFDMLPVIAECSITIKLFDTMRLAQKAARHARH